MLFAARKKSLSTLTWVVGILVLLAIGIILLSPVIPHPWTGEATNYMPYVWVVLIAGILALAARFLMKPLGEDTAAINLWGALGIIIGIGFASIADIWVNGYTFFVAMVGEFAPAAGPNIINSSILAPILLAAYKAVQARTGR
jgi:hypothetical protein